MARANRYFAAVVLVLFGACTSAETTTTQACTEPPETETQASTEFTLSLSADPVRAASTVQLSVAAEVADSDRAVVGAAVTWQCWNGTEWVDTHQILRGHYGDYRVMALDPGVVVTQPAVGILLPNTFTIQVPDVEPGTYRITDAVFVDGGQRFAATITVRVR